MKKTFIISVIGTITFSIVLLTEAQEQKGADNKNTAKPVQVAPAAQIPSPAANSNTNLVRSRTEMIARVLNLTDEQKEKAQPIIEEETKKLQELRLKKDLTPQERAAKMREIREATYQKMKPILTEEQWKKFYRPLTNITVVPQKPTPATQQPIQSAPQQEKK
ncbi:MAG: hypothetical protein ACP5MG_04110 [Verrucomicrobiia bacterium]|jgi:membrane-bound lytic murein transglycosylase